MNQANKSDFYNNISDNLYFVTYWVKIVVLNSKYETIEIYLWDNLPYKIRLKYDWYFTYRAALLQVKYPKFSVRLFGDKIKAQGKAFEDLKKSKIQSKKAQITKAKNKLDQYKIEFENFKNNYSKIFPIEDENEYKVFIESIDLAQSKIEKLELELKSILTKTPTP